jgi:hypothetical protein
VDEVGPVRCRCGAARTPKPRVERPERRASVGVDEHAVEVAESVDSAAAVEFLVERLARLARSLA